MNSAAAYGSRGEKHVLENAIAPLTDLEISELAELLSDTRDANGNDLLAFSGAHSIAGLLTRVMLAEGQQRTVLLTAIRRALAARG